MYIHIFNTEQRKGLWYLERYIVKYLYITVSLADHTTRDGRRFEYSKATYRFGRHYLDLGDVFVAAVNELANDRID